MASHEWPDDVACDRVLVVDDNADMLASMRLLLEIHGIHVQTATCPEEADSVLGRGFEPDAIVLDVRLGNGERGDDYARRLQASLDRSAARIILMSADVHELRRLRGHATLAKPFDVDHLMKLLVRTPA